MSGEPINLLVVVGSLREASLNRRLAQLAMSRVPDGVHAELFDGLAAVEPYDEDTEATGFPPGAAAFARRLRAADAVLYVTPEYNGSVPGQLKNALDWASRPDEEPPSAGIRASSMYGRPAAVAAASNGQFGAAWARDELVKILRTQGARVVDEPRVAVARIDRAFDEQGVMRNLSQLDRLDELLMAVVEQARSLRAARDEAAHLAHQ